MFDLISLLIQGSKPKGWYLCDCLFYLWKLLLQHLTSSWWIILKISQNSFCDNRISKLYYAIRIQKKNISYFFKVHTRKIKCAVVTSKLYYSKLYNVFGHNFKVKRMVPDVSWCKTILVAPVDHCLTTYLKIMVWILIMLQMLILLILQKHVRRKKASVVLEWSANSYFKKHERLVKDLESQKQRSYVFI